MSAARMMTGRSRAGCEFGPALSGRACPRIWWKRARIRSALASAAIRFAKASRAAPGTAYSATSARSMSRYARAAASQTQRRAAGGASLRNHATGGTAHGRGQAAFQFAARLRKISASDRRARTATQPRGRREHPSADCKSQSAASMPTPEWRRRPPRVRSPKNLQGGREIGAGGGAHLEVVGVLADRAKAVIGGCRGEGAAGGFCQKRHPAGLWPDHMATPSGTASTRHTATGGWERSRCSVRAAETSEWEGIIQDT